MQIKPGVAFVSDIAAHHAEVLYGDGTRTLAALCDLAEICQAAVLNDTLAVSPTAYHASTLLQQLDFIDDPTPKVEETPLEQGARQENASSDEEILIDVDEHRELTSDHPTGRLYLAHLAGELLQDSRIFWALANPEQLDRDQDRGLYFLDKLPAFIFLLQAKKGAAAFESDEVRQELLNLTKPDLTAYAKYATRVLALQEAYSVQPVFSCLEQPLGDEVRVNRAIETIQTPAFWEEFRAKLTKAVTADRSGFFERWTVPPFGLMVLSQAKHLDDVPKVIAKLRDTFLKVRRELIELEEAKQAALFAGGGLDDRQYKDVVRIDQRIKKAFEAFDASLADHRRSSEIKRSEWVFNMPKYINWLTSFGIGSVGHIIEFANLKRRNYLSYIPGLYKAVSFIKRCDNKYIVDIVERLLGRPFDAFGIHAAMLQFAVDKVQTYATFEDGAAPEDTDVFTIGIDSDKIEIPHSQLWARMLKDKESPLRQLLLHPKSI